MVYLAKDTATRTQEISVVLCASRLAVNHLPHGGDDVLNGEAEVLEQHAGRSGLAESVDADDRAVESHVFVPVVGHARFDRDVRDAARKDGVAVARVLAVERTGGRHRYHADGDAFGREHIAGTHRQRDFRAGGDEDDAPNFRGAVTPVREHVRAAPDRGYLRLVALLERHVLAREQQARGAMRALDRAHPGYR